MNNILIIDGNSLFFKSFWATYKRLEMGYERGKNNEPVNALRTFSLLIINSISKYEAKEVIVAFDKKDLKTYRSQFDFYKSQRNKQPDELYEQMQFVRDFLDLYGVRWIENSSLEADDIIGIYSKHFSSNKQKSIIITSDKDLLQLVDENTEVHLSRSGVSSVDEYNFSNFSSKLNGLIPRNIPEYKALAGDSSDNIAGIKGIGKVTATNLLLEYKNLDNLLLNIENSNSKFKDVILENKDNILCYRKIAQIIRDWDLLPIEDIRLKSINKKTLNNFLYEKNLFNVINKLNL